MKHTTVAFSLALIFACVVGTASAGKLYRWVDEKGEVHYTDSVPPDQTQKAHQELNKQGITVDQVDKAKSAEQAANEQRAKEDAERQRREEQERRIADQLATQRLLDSYASDQDIISARERNLAMIDGTINFSKSNLAKLHVTLDKLEKDLPTAGTDDTKQKIQKNIDQTKLQIADIEIFIKTKLAERQTIETRFNEDLARYRSVKQKDATAAK